MSAEPVPVPVAWWHVAENGDIRCWTSAHADVLRLAREIGVHLTPLYDRATLDAAVAAARAEERAKWQPAIALAQQCIAAAYEDRWAEFDRLSDDFDDACADAVLPMTPDAAIRDLKPEGE